MADEQALVLPPAEFDRLVAEGQIAEDGTPLSQEGRDQIDQSDDAERYPALPAPRVYADAK